MLAIGLGCSVYNPEYVEKCAKVGLVLEKRASYMLSPLIEKACSRWNARRHANSSGPFTGLFAAVVSSSYFEDPMISQTSVALRVLGASRIIPHCFNGHGFSLPPEDELAEAGISVVFTFSALNSVVADPFRDRGFRFYTMKDLFDHVLHALTPEFPRPIAAGDALTDDDNLKEDGDSASVGEDDLSERSQDD